MRHTNALLPLTSPAVFMYPLPFPLTMGPDNEKSQDEFLKPAKTVTNWSPMGTTALNYLILQNMLKNLE